MRPFARTLVLAFGLAGWALYAHAALPADAQSQNGEIVITVVDAGTGSPVPGVDVFLLGARTTTALTDRAGSVHFTDVPPGIYRADIQRGGYRERNSGDFEVLAGRRVSLRFALITQLRVIGTVHASASTAITSSELGEGGALRRLSPTLLDALGKIAGVNVDQTAPDGSVTISLRNHDPGQTGIAVNGVVLPGGASALRAVGTDLFNGGDVSFEPQGAFLGGSVNFRTLEPTRTWQYKLSASYGTYEHSFYQFATTGSAGKLALAAQYAWRGAQNPLTGVIYPDASGLTYPHEGQSKQGADFIKVRYTLDKRTTLSASTLSGNILDGALCTEDVTNLPCGQGPDIYSYARFNNTDLGVQTLVGNVALNANVYGGTQMNFFDGSRRYVAGTPAPAINDTPSHFIGWSARANIAHRRHNGSLNIQQYASHETYVPLSPIPYQHSYANVETYSNVTVGDEFKANDHLTLSGSVSLANGTGAGTSSFERLGATWKPSKADSFDAELTTGGGQPPGYRTQVFGDPSDAEFDCRAGTAIANGPWDAGAPQRLRGADVTWTHTSRSGETTLDVYRQDLTGQTGIDNVPIAYEPPGYLPPNYVAALQQVWSLPAVCAGYAFQPQRVYISQRISGTGRLYQGFDFSGRYALSRDVVVLPTYATNEAILTAGDRRILNPQSDLVLGRQIHTRPLHTAGLTLDGLLPKAGLEWLANGQWTDGNNEQNLGSYIVVNAGLSHSLGRGRATVPVTNALDTDAGLFATHAYSVPTPLNNGTELLTAATPLAPRSFTLLYTLNLGRAK
ncbi:MAG: TonB-dependent receptor [Candidatus Eremiobacteraeota bacterium]|nr:TonB-dependent receptor [Candidatus Eremiobacteraeota bacterium]